MRQSRLDRGAAFVGPDVAHCWLLGFPDRGTLARKGARRAGILLGGAPGVVPAGVVILGGAVVGTHATRKALGLGGRVTVVDSSVQV
jgi:hypothetical protein